MKQKGWTMMNEKVNHPAHYNKPGRKECIVEMLEIFGIEKVLAFCELNAYKYIYRSDMKGGQEDKDKALWYVQKQNELAASDERVKIAKHYGLEAQMQQLIEEMAELTQAICKHKRKNGEGQPINDAITARHVEENLIEELADVRLVLDQVILLLGCDKDIQQVENKKVERTLGRIGEENAE